MSQRQDPEPMSTADLLGRSRDEAMEQPDMTATDAVVSTAPPGMPARADTQATRLFSDNDTQDYRSRWDQIQTGFVDEPRQAVEQADSLVAEVIQRLATVFADERSKLEDQWGRGDDISTEDLRVALQRYRSFFDRLLSV